MRKVTSSTGRAQPALVPGADLLLLSASAPPARTRSAHSPVHSDRASISIRTMIDIRLIEASDWQAIWSLIEPVFRAGETYAFSPEISEEEAYAAWVETPTATFVAQNENGTLLGTYYLKANQPYLGAHVCNCGYIVGEKARGQGVATQMCEHSQREAIARGFRAMQFNLVASTNEIAIRLWQKLGFDIAGTLPGAFLHPQQGYVDAFVMYKKLVDNSRDSGVDL